MLALSRPAADDEVMTRLPKVAPWASILAVGLVVVVLGIYFALRDLDRADKWSSVVGGIVALLGLGLSGYGLLRGRRDGPPSGQVIESTTVGGDAAQIRNVRGDLRIGPATARTISAAPSESIATARDDGQRGSQSVTGSTICGSLHQIDTVGGDTEIDR
ncbi:MULTISPECIES: hypothetical protein [unclassified Micromonospora]|uniref:hypothetical protein n=1 Tax=unclassified Micromonospora TaxID=2617518 RepID=UPI002FEFD268